MDSLVLPGVPAAPPLPPLFLERTSIAAPPGSPARARAHALLTAQISDDSQLRIASRVQGEPASGICAYAADDLKEQAKARPLSRILQP
eukprot:CAMPEP_0182909804 /NCGR_PEP_ID=MMETSP0034_2-20130328/35959_1 /TAXON_ID=156128 /ORGANISM="Nephroselmis pyriformis, Strain CCMP717" /LENGTH=88 /DNA_ID=CAMNT_0025046083 /DNA_START=1 /DNA_END=264 /DNA_ORIENTATION=+